MVDINNDKIEIVNFLSKTITKITENFSEPKSIGFSCKPSEGLITISFNIKSEIDKEKLNAIEFEYKNIDSLYLETWKLECQKEISQWFYFKERGVFESSGTQKIYNINKYLTHILWRIIRDSTKEINLPTTLLSFEFDELSRIVLDSSVENFGRLITRIFRNEIFRDYIKKREQYRNPNFIDTINPNLLQLEISKFYSSLTNEQIVVLDKVILGTIDSIAFNVMRALEENDEVESGIILSVDGKDIRESSSIESGILMGEYFDWVERFSEYGEFQL